ncbi:MAG: hypothetical protein ACJ8AO_06790 [Gemmatimonadaceae bacterium]
MRPSRRHAAPFALATLAAAAMSAQSPAAPSDVGPQFPARGTLVRDTVRERGVLEQVKVPEGFSAVVFAGPPIAMYPTVVAPAPDGSVYMGTDLNLAQGAVKGRGRIVRLVDENGDGHADHYSIFAKVDSPRGLVVDGSTVYVLHVPFVTAFRDDDGDGVAERADTLVRDLGFGLDVRASDHSTNNLQLGIDGWLYVAVGDYGYLNARGKDGRTITNRGGAVVRVRPDGTGLETYAVGTRNIYDVGVDPFGHVFARDNTNDGLGWDTRLHYVPFGAHMGYPSLFRNFADEHMRSVADYGAGAGTSGLWVQDPGFPDDWNNALYTGDWTVNKVFRHRVAPSGATFQIDQTDFATVPRVVDMAVDDRSRIYLASLVGGVFNYMGDTVGAIVRVTYPGRPQSRALGAATLTDARLLDALGSASYERRLMAQRELLRRGARASTVRGLERLMDDASRPAEARAAAVFTLAQLGGARAIPALNRAAADPRLRAVALKAMGELPEAAHPPVAPFVSALADADAAVRMQAVAGLVRLGARERGADIARLLADPDSAVSHVAARGLAMLGARDAVLAALTTGPSAGRARARQALGLMHDTATVAATVAAFGAAADPDVKHEMLLALARLANVEAPWRGEWWGTQPNTIGPYYVPAAWEGSAAARPALRDALLAARDAERDRLVDEYARERVLPLGARALLAAVGPAGHAELADALVGSASIPAAASGLLERLYGRDSTTRAAVAAMLAQESGFALALAPLVSRAVADSALPWAVRGQVLAAAGRLNGNVGLEAAAAIFALANPTPGAAAPAPPNPNALPAANAANAPGADPGPAALDQAWRRFVGARDRQAQLPYFVALARGADPAQRVLGFSALVQSVRNVRFTPETVRSLVAPVLAAAWSDPVQAASLVAAIRTMRLESQYAEQLKAYAEKGGR